MDGKTHNFKSEKKATDWLLEDEYTSFNAPGKEDEKKYGITLNKIEPPSVENDVKLKGLMYVKA